MNIWYISDITVRARSSSSEISRQSFIYCLHHVQQVMTSWAWLLRTAFNKNTFTHDQIIFPGESRVWVVTKFFKESLTSTRFDQWLKPQEWYENFLRNFYFEGNGPSKGVCLQKGRENSLIKEGIKPTRDLRWPWRCISVEIFSVSFSLSRSLASHNNFSILNSTMVKKNLTHQTCLFSDENYENSYLFPLLGCFNFFECLKSFGVSIQMKATKFFGMELFAFRQFSKTKTWRFCWTSWLWTPLGIGV